MSDYSLKRFVLKTIKLENYKKDYRLRKKMPSFIHQVLIGLLLSDGSLERPTPLGGVRFSINLSLDNIALLLHIYNILEPFIDSNLQIRELKVKDKEYTTVGMKTVILPSLVDYYIQFYKTYNGNKVVKIVPENILEEMTAVVLAYMIMGDGNYNKEKRIIRIYTNSFTMEDVEKIVEAINKKLGIVSRKQHDRRGQYIILIEKGEVEKVREIVRPYMHNTMEYRLGQELNTNKRYNYEKIRDDI